MPFQHDISYPQASPLRWLRLLSTIAFSSPEKSPANPVPRSWPELSRRARPLTYHAGTLEQPAPFQRSQTTSQRARPLTYHAGTGEDLIYPVLDVEAPAQQNLGRQISQRGRSRPMPEGEHSVAARSRIRANSRRRAERSCSPGPSIANTYATQSQRVRRPKTNPTQSLRSSRRYSPSPPVPQMLSAEDLRKLRDKKQKQKTKKEDRYSLPLRLPLRITGDDHAYFTNPWAEDRARRRHGQILYRDQDQDQIQVRPHSSYSPLIDGSGQPRYYTHHTQYTTTSTTTTTSIRSSISSPTISPKTKPLTVPTLIARFEALSSPLAKAEATLSEVAHRSPGRKKRDVSHYPCSVQRYTTNLVVEGVRPRVLQWIRVVRKMSDGRPSVTPASIWAGMPGTG